MLRRILIVAALALAATAAPAPAAEVARHGGVVLRATDERDGSFCLSLTGDEGGGSSGCGPAPVRPYRTMVVSDVEDERVLIGGAGPAAAARVEAELADGRRVDRPTLAGERYRGRVAGRVRFFLLEVPATDRGQEDGGGVVLLRLYDAAGTLLGAVEPSHGRERVSQRTRLLTQRRRGASIVVDAVTGPTFAPTPLMLDRFEEQVCLVVRSRQGSSGGRTGTCRDPAPYRPVLALSVESGCGRLRAVVHGFVGDRVTAVRLRLGSGRALEIPSATLPPAHGAHRYVAALLPRGEAVRHVTAVGARGRQDLHVPPSGLRCVETSGGLIGIGEPDPTRGEPRPPAPHRQVAAEAEGHRLVVGDTEADRLCWNVDELRADAADCRLPDLDPGRAVPEHRRGMLAAVLPAEVARVRLPDGRDVATVAGDGYTGRYAGHVRFLLAPLRAGASGRVRYLGPGGEILGSAWLGRELPPTAGPVTIARGRGWRLRAARYDRFTCVGLAVRGDASICEAGAHGHLGAFALATCAPRRVLLYGVLPPGRRRIAAVLAGGRRLPARVVTLPRRIGGGRAYVLVLPRNARVTALAAGRRRIAFDVLPAARQCGYWLAEPFLTGGAIRVVR